MGAGRDYIGAIRPWWRDVVSDPGAWLSMSAMFILVALPVVTWGCAWTLLAVCAARHSEGRKFKCFPECGAFFSSRLALRAFIFGLADLIFALAFAVSLKSLVAADATVLSRLLSCVLLWIDALFLLSGIYRYPMLAADPRAPFREVLSKGVLLTISNLPSALLVFMAGLCVSIVSLCAGIFLFAFLPGALALLHRYYYMAIFGETDRP